MKINNKILFIPPFISTTWNHIKALCLKEDRLIISLANDTLVEVPDLQPEHIELIFSAHATFLENQSSPSQEFTSSFRTPQAKANSLFNAVSPSLENEKDPSLVFGLGSFDSLGSAMHHNESQANMPDLPKEILSKISAIAKIVAPEDGQSLPSPEPHCNCAHCQIARAVQIGLESETVSIIEQFIPVEEEINDADLNFQQWDIHQTGEKLFSVSHRLDLNDKYNVYLGNPVGCTCGKEGCEHILAVLKS
ncbi:MAG: hypothetical protein H0X29_10060 [Parachlamydiaceae bacterium]|nr:hypothetical protein [Parachlamydiaceae bacterium]